MKTGADEAIIVIIIKQSKWGVNLLNICNVRQHILFVCLI